MKEALYLTIQTMNDRLRWYRKLIVAMMILSLISILLAILQMAWQPLLGFLFLIPLCSIFLYLDSLLVQKWQIQIIKMWRDGQLDLTIFLNSIKTIRMFPQRMFDGMLKILPETAISMFSRSSKNPDRKVRSLMISILQIFNREQKDDMILMTLIYSFISSSIVLAGILKSWMFLLGFLLIPLAIGFNLYLRTIRRKRLKNVLLELKKHASEGFENFVDIIFQMDEKPIFGKKRHQLLNL
jgi:drug/metabolite transporter (DMT)-like permease